MKRKTVCTIILAFILTCSFLFTNGTVKSVKADSNTIYLGGIPAGFSLEMRGATVVGLCDVVTANGIKSPAKEADLRVGDIILSIDNTEINNADDIEKTIRNKDHIFITLNRNGSDIQKTVSPAKDVSGAEKLGVFIKSDVSGIGTVTFIKGNRFASLGHPVIDEDGKTLNIFGGEIYNCNITGCVKGERGNAGELRGVFLKNNAIGEIDKNIEYGVYGNINDNFDLDDLTKIDAGEAVVGDASIYTTISGYKPEKFSISIIKIDGLTENKNFVIKINDKKLLEQTNGIVQGMSGSPIVQNGKLVGAVTHVFINDPTRGFGLSIDNMLNN